MERSLARLTLHIGAINHPVKFYAVSDIKTFLAHLLYINTVSFTIQ